MVVVGRLLTSLWRLNETRFIAIFMFFKVLRSSVVSKKINSTTRILRPDTFCLCRAQSVFDTTPVAGLVMKS